MVDGSGTKRRVIRLKVGTTGKLSRLVETRTGVTSDSTPPGWAVVDWVAEAGPWAKPMSVMESNKATYGWYSIDAPCRGVRYSEFLYA